MGRPMFSATPVSCKRGNTFDAEISFKEESYDYSGGEMKSDVIYNQRLLMPGFKTSEAAKMHAEVACSNLEEVIRNAASNYLGQFKEAKP